MRAMSNSVLVLFGLLPQSGVVPAGDALGDVVGGTVSLDGRPAVGAVVYLERWQTDDRRESGTTGVAHADTVVLDQRGLRFVPGTLVVWPGTTVAFLNNDDIQHNVFSPGRAVGGGDPFDLGTYARGERRYHTFGDHGPHTILCNVHPEMLAYVVSVPADHKTVTDRDGRFTLTDVPSGPYLLRVWHPRSRSFEMAIQVGSRLRQLNITLEAEN